MAGSAGGEGVEHFTLHVHCAWSACDGGSLALAIATRQSYCEFEIVPSLHSNLRGASTVVGGFAATGVC